MKKHAKGWLKTERVLIEKGKWTSPADRAKKAQAKKARKAARTGLTLEEYGRAWIEQHDLADSTRSLWERQLETYLYPKLGALPLRKVKTPQIAEWHAWAKLNVPRRPREGAYCALRLIMSAAVSEDRIKKNPCTLKKVVQRRPDRTGVTLTPTQVEAVAIAMGSTADAKAIRTDVREEIACVRAELAGNSTLDDVTKRKELAKAQKAAKRAAMVKHGIDKPEWVALVALGCYSALRTAELQALRRRHVSTAHGEIDVEFAARYLRPRRPVADGTGQGADSDGRRPGRWVGEAPVKAEGERQVPIVPHMLELLQHHLDHYVDPEPDALLFPPTSWTCLTSEQKLKATPAQRNQRLASSTIFDYWKAALERAGVPDVHFHDLRHTGGSLYTQAGATLKEVMEFMGHRSPETALSYQHGNLDRHRTIAAEVSRRATDSLNRAA
ncbi:tyrosine-type recombinase/integrase [Demequina flava]|uniref:tyrosine-type recombinase/integrase n=1 Tax=Demequina flava TaxID=1095025 RepID=UPI00078506DB|nr:site-specific integrase [Demequina flava]